MYSRKVKALRPVVRQVFNSRLPARRWRTGLEQPKPDEPTMQTSMIPIECAAGRVLDKLVALAAMESTNTNISQEEIDGARSALVFDALDGARELMQVIEGKPLSPAKGVSEMDTDTLRRAVLQNLKEAMAKGERAGVRL